MTRHSRLITRMVRAGDVIITWVFATLCSALLFPYAIWRLITRRHRETEGEEYAWMD